MKIIGYFFVFLFGFGIGCMLSFSQSDRLWSHQLTTHIKHELKNTKNVTFFIPDTDISITKLRDGSGIIRIKEGR
jgi:hypothetical protein